MFISNFVIICEKQRVLVSVACARVRAAESSQQVVIWEEKVGRRGATCLTL